MIGVDVAGLKIGGVVVIDSERVLQNVTLDAGADYTWTGNHRFRGMLASDRAANNQENRISFRTGNVERFYVRQATSSSDIEFWSPAAGSSSRGFAFFNESHSASTPILHIGRTGTLAAPALASGGDGGQLVLAGGSALSTASGALLQLRGKDFSGDPGGVLIATGVGGIIRLSTSVGGSLGERVRITNEGRLLVGTSQTGITGVGGIRAAGRSVFDDHVDMTGLPTTSPGGSGRLWRDAQGYLRIT